MHLIMAEKVQYGLSYKTNIIIVRKNLYRWTLSLYLVFHAEDELKSKWTHEAKFDFYREN